MTAGLPDLDDYQFFESLGRGTLGVVYRARDRRSNGLVAVKWCPAKNCDLNRTALHAVHDPALFVPVVTAGVTDDFVYVVSEYQDAGSLAARLNDFGPLSAEAAAKLLRALCHAVEQLHSAGIVHGRLKPTDVLFADQQAARLSDQMLVALQSDDSDPFRPPELEATVSGDIYRLGGILYAALTAQPPLRSGGSIYEEPLAPRKLASGVPHVLQDICLKCLARSPAARYATVAQLAEELECFLSGRPLAGIEVEDSLSPWLWLSKHPMLVTTPLALLAISTLPITLAAGLTAMVLGVFLKPLWSWTGTIAGTAYGALMLACWFTGIGLSPLPPHWTLLPTTIGIAPWFQWLINFLNNPSLFLAGHVVCAALGGWTWQALRAVDQRQRTWLAWPYLLVLLALPWIVTIDHILIGQHERASDGLASLLLAVVGLPCGMLLAESAWATTLKRTPLDNARLAAVLGILLAALAWSAIPVAFRTNEWGGQRPIRADELLVKAERSPHPASAWWPRALVNRWEDELQKASFWGSRFRRELPIAATRLTLVGLASVVATAWLSLAATFPRTMTTLSVIAGLGAVLSSTIQSLVRDPELLSMLPGGASTGVLFFALGVVVAIAMVARQWGLSIGSTPVEAHPVVPGFSGRVVLASVVAVVLIGIAAALGQIPRM